MVEILVTTLSREVRMKYEKIKDSKEEESRRLIGVRRSTFKKMIGILEEAEK
ncbi:hypothetical protein [Holospora elegans]|uniref:hypothetical protein n=1 Tax=Holospora elegans TaxID=431043 RepID=UPI00139F2B65|nr:hypothetical protein [Holospora elegans]